MRHIWWVFAVLFALAGPPGAWAAGNQVPTLAPDDVFLGKADAPVTIFEYASLTCPHCAAFDTETLPKLKTEWIDPGKAKLVFRDYPLDQSALKAAILARCAPPDRLFNFLDVLFRSQMNWAAGGDPTQALSRIARLGGIGEAEFTKCMADQKLADRIVASRLVGQDQYGIESTPTFFVNGKKVVGALPYEQFENVLTVALADTGAKVTPPAAASAPPSGPSSPAVNAAPAPSGPATPAEPNGWFDRMKSSLARLWASTLAYFR